MPKVSATDAKVHQRRAGGRRGRGARVATSLAEINVVPLVDVMLVLLVIFMVTAPMMQQGLNVNLPQARRARSAQCAADLRDDPRRFRGSGASCRSARSRSASRCCSERVRQVILPREDKSLFVRMDAAVTAQDFYSVFDELKRAGVDKVGARRRDRRRAA